MDDVSEKEGGRDHFCENGKTVPVWSRGHTKGAQLDKESAGWISVPTFFLSQVSPGCAASVFLFLLCWLSYSVQLKPQMRVLNQKQLPKHSFSCHFILLPISNLFSIFFSCLFSICLLIIYYPQTHFLQSYCLVSNSSFVTFGITNIICI